MRQNYCVTRRKPVAYGSLLTSSRRFTSIVLSACATTPPVTNLTNAVVVSIPPLPLSTMLFLSLLAPPSTLLAMISSEPATLLIVLQVPPIPPRVRRSYSVWSKYKRIWSEYLFALKRIFIRFEANKMGLFACFRWKRISKFYMRNEFRLEAN
jgi:hypothetical protein